MLLFIPLAHGQSIPHDVFKSIAWQSFIMEIVPCCSDGLIKSNHTYKLTGEQRSAKIQGELKSRNLAVSYLTKIMSGLFVAMQDRDIVHLQNDNFERCAEYLLDNKNVGAVALPWKNYPVTDHIRNAAFVIRTDLFKKLKFRIDNRNHICATMKEDIEALGYIYEFLPSTHCLIKEI